MSVAVAEVLGLWREAERLLEAMPEGSPDRVVVEDEVDRLHAIYLRLTGAQPQSELAIQLSMDTVHDAAEVLRAARMRIARG